MEEDHHSYEIASSTNDAIPLTVINEVCCCPPATEKVAQKAAERGKTHQSGCMVCGAALVYFETNRDQTCHYCRQTVQANAACTNGHFVCDHCHSADAVEIIRNVCLQSQQADPVALMQVIRSHPRFPVNGPEHHAMVPAVILAALRNCGQSITDQQIITAIQRGQTIIGGSCAFLGACGAAIGVGIAVSLLLGATPYHGDKRQAAQQATQTALGRIASLNAPRCCQRDSWLALREASALFHEYTGIWLTVNPFACEQFPKNKECINQQCPLWPFGEWE